MITNFNKGTKGYSHASWACNVQPDQCSMAQEQPISSSQTCCLHLAVQTWMWGPSCRILPIDLKSEARWTIFQISQMPSHQGPGDERTIRSTVGRTIQDKLSQLHWLIWSNWPGLSFFFLNTKTWLSLKTLVLIQEVQLHSFLLVLLTPNCPTSKDWNSSWCSKIDISYLIVLQNREHTNSASSDFQAKLSWVLPKSNHSIQSH